MFGLILKDIYCLKTYIKTLGLVLILFGFISWNMDNASVYLGSFFAMWSIMISITTFSYDHLAKWDHYARSLPLTKNEIVLSKYFFTIICCAVGILLAFFLDLIVLTIKSEPFNLLDQLQASLLCLSFALLFSSVLLPLIIKFGVEKARLLIILIATLPFILILLIEKFNLTVNEFLVFKILYFLPLIAIIIFGLSYFLSVSIYGKKDI